MLRTKSEHGRGTQESSYCGDAFRLLRDLYVATCPPGYELQERVNAFYSSAAFWEKFRGWLENAPDLYPAGDKAFVESVITVDGLRIVNIGTFYPWAEIEWGARAAEWVGLDCNPDVLQRARAVLRGYPDHRVTLLQADVTAPLHLPMHFDCVLDLSTLDQLDPRAYQAILENYTRMADRLILAYDATEAPIAEYDFEQCGFNALLNPAIMATMLEQVGYRVVEHRPFAHAPYRSYVMATRRASA